MSIRLVLEESYHRPRRVLRFTRSLFLLIGVGALGYGVWIYGGQYLHELDESRAFDLARASRNPARPALTEEDVAPPPVGPFRAKLVIARLHLTAMVEEGVEEDTLRRAAGHIPRTALPGQFGNVAVAGHRDTLFRGLKGIKIHDFIVLSTLTKDYNYEVTATTIVRPNDVSVLAPVSGQKTLTLITCYPFHFIGAAPQRFIVQAKQIAETAASAAADFSSPRR